MAKADIKKQQLDIVLIGDFNPHIFQPQWFVFQKLLGEKEGESVKIDIIHSDLAIFNLDWLRFEVTRNRLVAMTKFDQYYEILRDLIIGTFDILAHTPIKMIGINNSFDYIIDSESNWHKIGDTLAPKDIWNKIIEKPGLRSLVIESKPVITDKYKNIVRITVGPIKEELSFRIVVNNHHELVNIDNQTFGSDRVMNIFREKWDDSQKEALKIRDTLLTELL